MNGVEKEFKWDASPRGAFARFVRALERAAGPLSAPEDIRITDRYLDNGRGDFSARKVALRLRRSGGAYEATLKSRGAVKAGLAQRTELTKLFPQARSFAAALRMLQQEGSWEGLDLDGLHVRFVLRNRRRTYTVRFRSAVCEAALDDYVISAGERKLHKREIELELKSGAERDFFVFIQKLGALSGLEAVKISKVASAEKMLEK